MNATHTSGLLEFSSGLESLVQAATAGIVAVKALSHRTTTGVCIAPTLIAVADHALKKEERIPVIAADGQQFSGTLLGRMPSIDLAIIKTENTQFAPLPFAEPASLRTGALAVVVGLTLDVGPSASLGILGAVGDRRRTWRGGVLDRFIRLDVNLYPSQIGAAVLNIQGQLIGMATPALLRHSAVAIPATTLQSIGQELLQGGDIRPAYLGVGVQQIALPDSMRTKINVDLKSGLMLMSINPESPAEKAGMQLGDILISLGDRKLTSVEDLQEALNGATVGSLLSASVVRGGNSTTLPVTVEERPRGKQTESA